MKNKITRSVSKEHLKEYNAKFREIDELLLKLAESSEIEREKLKSKIHGLCVDPSIFAYVYFKDKEGNRYRPFPYQDLVLNDESQQIIVVKGRQIGITDVLSIKAFHKAVMEEKHTVCIVSKTEDMAKRIISRIREFRMNTPFARELSKGGTDNKFEVEISKKILDPISKRYIRVINKIISVPATDAARGLSVNSLYLDEAAFIGETLAEGDYIFHEVLGPTIMATKGQVMFVSTPPKVPLGFFYDTWSNGKNWSRYHFKSEICPLITKDKLDEKRDVMLEAAFRREYLGEFLASDNNVFMEKEINDAVDRTLVLGGFTSDPVFIGIDWGETQSNSAYAIVKADNPREPSKMEVKVVDLKEYPKRTDFMDIIREIEILCKKYNVRTILADKGIGGGQISTMMDMGLPVEGYSFSGGTRKADLVTSTKLLLEKRRIKIPDHRQLKRELGSYQQEYNPKTGRTKFFAPRAGGVKDHLLDAFMLVNFAVTNITSPPVGAMIVGEGKKPIKEEYEKKMECNHCTAIFEGVNCGGVCPYCGSKRIEVFK